MPTHLSNAVRNNLWRGLKAMGGVTITYLARRDQKTEYCWQWMDGEDHGWLNDTRTLSELSSKLGNIELSLDAIPGETEVSQEYELGQILSDRSQDFIVLRSSLEDVKPSVGDQILWECRCYEVLGLGVERQARWSDQYNQLTRIHTKELD